MWLSSFSHRGGVTWLQWCLVFVIEDKIEHLMSWVTGALRWGKGFESGALKSRRWSRLHLGHQAWSAAERIKLIMVRGWMSPDRPTGSLRWEKVQNKLFRVSDWKACDREGEREKIQSNWKWIIVYNTVAIKELGEDTQGGWLRGESTGPSGRCYSPKGTEPRGKRWQWPYRSTSR